ncbi:MAG TPA: hypothetical protein DCM86_17885, partial [Verrucomicrobiales bacterium]|nr:hypothetical protein [Verrucomicrobiales bacterium]
MTREEFDRLVSRVEGAVAGKPWKLRLRLVGLAALGYAGLLVGFFLALAVAALFFWAAVRDPDDGA